MRELQKNCGFMVFSINQPTSSRESSMASHDVALKVATELPVGAVDLEIPVKRNGRKIGTFTVNANGVSWNPSTSKAPTSVTWEELPAALSGAAAPAAAPAAPAKKAAPAAKKTTAKKATSKKAAAAPAPAAEPEAAPEAAPAETAPEATEAPAPAKRASGRKSAAKSAPAAKKSAPAAKKSAPAASTSGAVDARAVRQWAAENGITVAPRGPISSSIIDQFRAATS
ncbi:Lsr2 family DNA-binding protein [Kineococcus sp. SYSU DK018]|uniref:Lsr2 family DNA-binding protein n=1 Tax=Kineococcus sp. SYSU DK018 TaxID=3383139 RepID=UPI003D7DBE05